MPLEQLEQLPERQTGNKIGGDGTVDKEWKTVASAAFELLSTELEHVTHRNFTAFREQLPRESVWLLDAFVRIGREDRKSGLRLGYRVDDGARVNTLGLACLVAYFGGWLRKRGMSGLP